MAPLQVIAYIIAIIGWIWLVVIGFKHSIIWGVANLLIPLVALIFGFINFSEAKTPLLIMIVGALVAGIGLTV